MAKSALFKPFISLFLLAFLLAPALLSAQDKKTPPFWNEIQAFKKKDSISMPAKGGIVFVGSSSFRLWTELEKVYKKYGAINRGFGGSTITQANSYIDDLIVPYSPRQVVIYSGENDMAQGASAMEVLNNFAACFSNIRKKLPNTAVAYVSMKLSPSRTQYSDGVLHANTLIREFLGHYKNTAFIDVTSVMLAKDGSLRPELFIKDMLHMNQKGYDLWIKAITPHLLKK